MGSVSFPAYSSDLTHPNQLGNPEASISTDIRDGDGDSRSVADVHKGSYPEDKEENMLPCRPKSSKRVF